MTELQIHLNKTFEYITELEAKRVLCISQATMIDEQHVKILDLQRNVARMTLEKLGGNK